MIKIHKISGDNYPGMECFNLEFDVAKLMFEIRHTIKYFIGELLGYDLQSSEVLEIENEYTKICEELSSFNKVLVHRDFHSRNIMFKNDRPYIIDYQDARMGIPHYDLVSLLDDCYYQISSKNYEELMGYYAAKTGIRKMKEFRNSYSLMASQRVFKAIGSFAYMKVYKGDERYLINIGYSFEKLRSILRNNTRYSRLSFLLNKLYYAN